MKRESSKYTLDPYVSSLGAWALSLGTSIGWGSLVVTSNTYLLKSGPWGSVIGMLIGALIMLIISRNYHYMMNCFPDSGGAYTYSKEAFGFDHGFLTAWFLGLTYITVLWANATSLPLFSRYFLGSAFQFGFKYHLWGYEVYFGEALLSIFAIILIALLCIRYKHLSMRILIVTVMVFVVGIAVSFLAAMILRDGKIHSFEPGYIPDKNALAQIIRIACISPWAFIGFENISNLSEEFKFPHKKAFKILTVSVITTTVLYIFVTVLSVTAYPSNYGSWLDYIKDLDNIEGYKGLPAFYAAHHYLGNMGIYMMMATLLALVLSSLIGNITALSRLLYALAKDSIVPKRFKTISKWGSPAKVILLIVVISIPIPFLGRTAISWIVDVTTIGATIIYALVSASAFKVAKSQERSVEKWTGLLGVLLMIGFGLYLLIPNLISYGNMAEQTFLLFTAWGLLGFIYFRVVLTKDQQWRFGKTIVVWVGLLTLVLFIALIGMNQQMIADTDKAMYTIHEHYTSHGTVPDHLKEDEKFIDDQMQFLRVQNLKSSLVVFSLFLFAIVTMLANYSLIRKRAEASNEELGIAKMIAYTDSLTGVKSGHAFVDDGREIDSRILNKEMSDFALVVCDINDLKSVNDTMGHAVGDEYIMAGCSMICDIFVHSPVYRIGGDEFLVLLIGRDYINRYSLMDKLSRRTEDNLIHDKVVVACGMTEYDREVDDNILSVMERADEIMYDKKEN